MRIAYLTKPENRPATTKFIKTERDRREISPITIPGLGTFDADEKSQMRLEKAYRDFNTLPTLEADGTLLWRLADNSIVAVTRDDLNTVIQAISARAAKLHVKAVELENTPNLTEAQVLADESWV